MLLLPGDLLPVAEEAAGRTVVRERRRPRRVARILLDRTRSPRTTHLGLHPARADRVDEDARPPKLGGEDVGEGVQGRLGDAPSRGAPPISFGAPMSVKTLTIPPYRLRCISGTNASQSRHAPLRFIFSVSPTTSRSESTPRCPPSMLTSAFLTRTSSHPSSSSISRAHWTMPFSSVTRLAERARRRPSPRRRGDPSPRRRSRGSSRRLFRRADVRSHGLSPCSPR